MTRQSASRGCPCNGLWRPEWAPESHRDNGDVNDQSIATRHITSSTTEVSEPTNRVAGYSYSYYSYGYEYYYVYTWYDKTIDRSQQQQQKHRFGDAKRKIFVVCMYYTKTVLLQNICIYSTARTRTAQY
jgi:hypothetical protein